MSASTRVLVIVTGMALLGVLIFAAASDRIFFANQQLTPDTVVYTERDGFAFPFYKDSSNAVTVATVFHRVDQKQDGKLPVLFEVIPRRRYLLDTMHLELSPVIPPAAMLLENTGGGAPFPYEHRRTDTGSSVILDFPELDEYVPATISFTFWLDTAALDPTTPEKLTLDILFTTHEDSVFKLIKYSGKIAIQIAIPPVPR